MKNESSALEGQVEEPETAEMFRAMVRQMARDALLNVFAAEVESLCGPRHRPGQEAEHYRSGGVESPVYVEGGRESLRRPRVRRRLEDGSSEEALLKSWQLASDPGEWEEAMMRAVLCGVSTRKVAALRESEVRGESKSSLSRLWQKKAAALAEEMRESDLGDFDLLVLMVDAVVLSGGLVATVALGIDTEGAKKVLGFRVGSSENAEVCGNLLSDLLGRGLKVAPQRRLLAVLDGSSALKNGVLREFPTTLIQRCLVHKERNIRGYLPRKHWAELARLFQNLRRSQGEEAGKEAADAIEKFLRSKNAQARASFDEAGDELLTVMRLNVPNTLHVSLLSTNAIENVFKNLRRHIGRVCRWREETEQANLWLSSGLILASKGFRRISGHAEIGDLIHSLETL